MIPNERCPTTTVAATPIREAGSWALWIPRVVLSPFYAVNEYVMRRPIGAFVTHAEREHWADTVERRVHVRPAGQQRHLPDRAVRLRPAAERRRLLRRRRLSSRRTTRCGSTSRPGARRGSTRPPPIATRSTRHDVVAGALRLQALRGQPVLRHRPRRAPQHDRRATASSASRAASSYRHAIASESQLTRRGGVHRISFVDGDCCSNPVGRRSASPPACIALPPGYGETYTTAFARRRPRARLARAAAGAGQRRLPARARQPELRPPRRSLVDRSTAASSAARSISPATSACSRCSSRVDFVDPMHGRRRSRSPSTRCSAASSWPGFVPGWMTGRSTAAAQLGYRGRSGSGSTRRRGSRSATRSASTSTGSRPSKLRMSWRHRPHDERQCAIRASRSCSASAPRRSTKARASRRCASPFGSRQGF